MKKGLLLIPFFLLVGCANKEAVWQPLHVGLSWTYTWTDGLTKDVVVMEVERTKAVGKVPGFALTSPRGGASLAWDGSILVASELGATSFDPPIPLYIPGDSQGWTGTITTAGNKEKGQATISREEIKERIDDENYHAVATTLNLTVRESQHEIKTVFVRQIGIVRQVHLKDGTLISRLSYVSD